MYYLNVVLNSYVTCEPRANPVNCRSTHFLWEDGFIVELGLDPVHQVLHIPGCRNLYRFLNLHPISPPVLEPEIFCGHEFKTL
jgi:hypothetical protein